MWPSTDPDHRIGPQRGEGGDPPPLPMPETDAGFVTDIEIEYFSPVYVGDLLSTVGRKLVSVNLRQTRVGYGAFMVFESEVRNQNGELVAKLRNGSFRYRAGASE